VIARRIVFKFGINMPFNASISSSPKDSAYIEAAGAGCPIEEGAIILSVAAENKRYDPDDGNLFESILKNKHITRKVTCICLETRGNPTPHQVARAVASAVARKYPTHVFIPPQFRGLVQVAGDFLNEFYRDTAETVTATMPRDANVRRLISRKEKTVSLPEEFVFLFATTGRAPLQWRLLGSPPKAFSLGTHAAFGAGMGSISPTPRPKKRFSSSSRSA